MKFTVWQLIVSATLSAFTVLGVTLFAINKGWIPPSTLAAPLTGILVALAAFIQSRLQMAVKDKEAEVQIEKARSEMPPALKDAQIVAYRPRMPSVADLSELPTEAAQPATTTNVSVEVKS